VDIEAQNTGVVETDAVGDTVDIETVFAGAADGIVTVCTGMPVKK
jgi:hypothetical protein